MSTDAQAPAVADHLGNEGELPLIDWKGRKFKVAFPTAKTLSRIELRIAQTAYEELSAIGQQSDASAMVASRQHRARGPLWNETMKTTAGNALVLWGCICETHPDFTMDEANAMTREVPDQVVFALSWVAPRFLELIERMYPKDLPLAPASPPKKTAT